MKISIITVCFNSDKTIEKTIQSVLNQTHTEVEYIIIDGGSTDGTLPIIRKYENQIDYWKSEPDKGLYDAMNKGIEVANGSLIGILNSDDTFYSEDVLERISKLHSEKDVDASVGDIVQCGVTGELKRVFTARKWVPKQLTQGFMPPHPSIFFKKKLFEKHGLYLLDFKIAADYEIITRFFLKHNISWVYSGIVTTSMLMGGVSSSGIESYKKITKEIQRALTLNNVPFSRVKISLRFIRKIKECLV
ncbi:MAG: glycosyltransferase [Bacteroidetes bacterium]|nr:glycosyltransferase [Bacteroidota bacterium]